MTRYLISSFARSEDAAVAITTAISAVIVIGFAALSLNAGNVYYSKRKQQTATDLAAMAAAGDLSDPYAAAVSSVMANGFAAADIASIETGTYQPNPSVEPGQRFSVPPVGNANAVRVTMKAVKPYYFGRMFNPGSGAAITTQATSAANNAAAFSIGSGLITLDNGIANSVLGGLLGSRVSLSAMDYQTLASTNLNLFTFSNALATRANLSAGTYNALTAGTISLAAGLAAVLDSAQSSNPAAAAPLAALLAATQSQSVSFPLSALVNYGPYGTQPTGGSPPISATITALNLVSAMAQAANGSHQIQMALNAAAPGIASVSLELSIGEPAAGSSLVTAGAAGATLTTAQTRLKFDLQVAGPSPATLLDVPLVIDIASGTAVLENVQCDANSQSSLVQLGVTPGLVDLWIGSVSATSLSDFSAPLAPPAAPLVSIPGLLQISGAAHASIANTSPAIVSFTQTDITSATPQTVSTTDYLAPLLTSLFENLQLSTQVLGFSAANVTSLNIAIFQTLEADLAPVDTILSSTLAVLGISAGNATVWVTGVRCGQSNLVN